MCSGGAWIVGAASHLAGRSPWWVKWLTEEGIAVVSLDYRLAPHADLEAICDDVRRGHEFVTSGGLGKALADAGETAALDASRVGIFGPSAGGHIVSWLVSVRGPNL